MFNNLIAALSRATKHVWVRVKVPLSTGRHGEHLSPFGTTPWTSSKHLNSVPTGRVLFEIGGAPIREELAREGSLLLHYSLFQPLSTIHLLPQFYDRLPTNYLPKWNSSTGLVLHVSETSSYILLNHRKLTLPQFLEQNPLQSALQHNLQPPDGHPIIGWREGQPC